jgi:hypothetical protein
MRTTERCFRSSALVFMADRVVDADPVRDHPDLRGHYKIGKVRVGPARLKMAQSPRGGDRVGSGIVSSVLARIRWGSWSPVGISLGSRMASFELG